MIQEIKREIENALSGNRIDSASKRLLDLVWYYYSSTVSYDKAAELRKKYNQERTLGEGELNDQAIIEYKQQIESILNELDSSVEEAPSKKGEPLISVKELEKTFKHRSKSFSFGPVTIEINKGDIVGVVGENGNGKTTFLRLILEEISVDSGQIDYNYNIEEIAATLNYKRKNRTAFIPQRTEKWRGTLMENLTFFAAIHGYKGEANTKIVEYVIHRMGLTTFAGLSWSQLSSGYKLRFELAKMLVWQPDVLILDEPLANLDIQATQNLLEDLRLFANSTIHPIGILLTSQQLHEVEQIADKVLFLRNGKSVFAGSQNEFADSRDERIVELSCNLDLVELIQLISNEQFKVQKSGAIYKLEFPKSIEVNAFLKTLIDNNVELTYFRDITNSTVQLFKD